MNQGQRENRMLNIPQPTGFIDQVDDVDSVSSATQSIHAGVDTIRVLYVDSDPNILSEVTTVLAEEHDDLVVETAQSVGGARECLADSGIDCIVSGYALLGGDGLELLESIRKTHPDLPFILYADEESLAIADDALAAGVTNYLRQRGPDQYPILADLVTNAVRQYRKSRSLERTTKFYHTVLEQVPETVLLTDSNGEFKWVCPNVHRVFGYSSEEVTNLGSIDALFGDNSIDHSTIYQEEREEEVENVATTITTKEGTKRSVLVTATETAIDEEAILYTVRDITERRKRERKLEMAETIFQQSQDPAFLVDVLDDDKFRVRRVNEAYEEATGLATDDMAGKTPQEIVGDKTGAAIEDRYRECVVRRKPLEYEEELTIADETRCWQTKIAPVIEDGTVIELVGTTRDITDQKEREEKLRSERAFVESTLNALPDVFYAYDDTATLTSYNDELTTVTGYTAEELETMEPWELVASNDHNEIRDRFWGIIETGQTERVETRIRTKGGETIPYELHGGPLHGSDGSIEGVVGVGRDVTERKTYREQVCALHKTTRDLINAPDVETVGEVICDAIQDVLGLADGGLFRYDEGTESVAPVRITDGLADIFDNRSKRMPDGNLVERTFDRGEELVVNNVSRLDVPGTEGVSRSLCMMPIGDDAVVGYLDDTPGPFDERTLELARTLGAQTETALERTKRVQRFEAIFNNTYQFTGLLDPDGTLLEANETALSFGGLDRKEVVGKPVWETYWFQSNETARETARKAVEQARNGELFRDEIRVHGADREVVIDFSVRPVTDEQGTVTMLIPEGRDITERKRAQRRTEQVLTTVQETVPVLQVADSKRTVADLLADTIVDVLDHDIVGVYYYDETDGVLEPAEVTPAATDIYDEIPTFTGGDSLAWQAFAKETTVNAQNVKNYQEVYNPETPINSELILPLGSHGVVLIGSLDKTAFPEWEVEFIDTLTMVVQTALDRLDARKALPEYERELEQTEDQLEQVRSFVELASDLTDEVVAGSTKHEVVSGVCETLLSVDQFELAWFGKIDGDDITVDAWACEEKQVSEELLGASRGSDHPARRAHETGISQVCSEFAGEDRQSWLEEGLARGYQACYAVPIVYDDTRHGVVTVFAADPNTFDDETIRVLDEFVGPIVAYVLTATDRKRALVSDQKTELEFRITSEEFPFVSLAEQLECEWIHEKVVPYFDGSVATFYSVEGASPERVAGAANDLAAVEAVRVTEEGTVQLTQRTAISLLLADYGWTLRKAIGDKHDSRVTVGVSDNGSCHRVIETIQTHWSDVDLIAKRSDVSRIDHHGLETLFERELTDRQRDVLKTAYAMGYIRHSRECTGREVAERLDITQPTFNEHFWTGLKRLLATALDDD